MANKPWLTPAEQVQCLKGKGVAFELMSEADAEAYLRANNNYFRVASYRHGFPRVAGGKNDGKYVNLDFAMLQDLSVIDYLLRKTMLPITIDVEHFAKMELLRIIEAHQEDGYQIVQDFLDSETVVKDDGSRHCHILHEIKRGAKGAYTNKLIAGYVGTAMPVWVFLELIPFGSLCRFWYFCSERFANKKMRASYFQLCDVKNLRNACGHNNCILNSLEANTAEYQIGREVRTALREIDVSGDTLKTKLSNARLQHITVTLYMHSKMASEGVKAHCGEELELLIKRMYKNIGFYEKNEQVLTAFEYFKTLVKGWY